MLVLIGLSMNGIAQSVTEDEMIKILAQYDQEASKLCNKSVNANWNVQTDVTNTDRVAEQVSERRCKSWLLQCWH